MVRLPPVAFVSIFQLDYKESVNLLQINFFPYSKQIEYFFCQIQEKDEFELVSNE